jgi:hypothetical protein
VCKQCDDSQHDTCGWRTKIDYSNTGLENFYCPEAYSRTIKGDPFSKEHKFIKIGLKKCD